MIAYIEGRLAEITDNSCVIVTGGGVGYELFLPSHTLSKLPHKGEMLFLYVVTVVREDSFELFGFETWDERQTFNVLTSISRVGARTAIAILSVFRPDDLRRIVLEDDMLSLTRVSGIGKKTGQQIFLEMKYKLKGEVGLPVSVMSGKQGGVLADAVAGLVNLGYEEEDATRTVKQVLAEESDLDVGETLRAALKALARGRK